MSLDASLDFPTGWAEGAPQQNTGSKPTSSANPREGRCIIAVPSSWRARLTPAGCLLSYPPALADRTLLRYSGRANGCKVIGELAQIAVNAQM
jgi:hypothetical protein